MNSHPPQLYVCKNEPVRCNLTVSRSNVNYEFTIRSFLHKVHLEHTFKRQFIFKNKKKKEKKYREFSIIQNTKI